MTEDDWYGLYGSPWTDVVEGTMSHPAKYSKNLIREIYLHALIEGWVTHGDTVIDPFAGVALGAPFAMSNGLNWIGIELEKRFAEIGARNIEHWDNLFSLLGGLGRGTMIQGDSRRLLEILGDRGVNLSLSSPPYADLPVTDNQRKSRHELGDGSMDGPTPYGNEEGNLGNMQDGDIDMAISSPPYEDSMNQHPSSGDKVARLERLRKAGYNVDDPKVRGGPHSVYSNPQNYADLSVSSPPFGTAEIRDRNPVQPGFIEDCITRAYTQDKQGTTEGNLSGMDTSTGPALALSSPPYAETDLGGGAGILRRDPKIRDGHGFKLEDENYGSEEGQLGNMKGDLDAALAVSSPPYAETRIAHEGGKAYMESIRRPKDPPRYGTSEAQLGAKTKENFWVAALDIVHQVFLALRPGGHAIWVTKRYVKGGEIVEFSKQWLKICEAAGFELVHWHRAWFTETRRKEFGLFGDIEVEKVDHKGFFRRLAERKGSPRIDWEDILCMRKP